MIIGNGKHVKGNSFSDRREILAIKTRFTYVLQSTAIALAVD